MDTFGTGKNLHILISLFDNFCFKTASLTSNWSISVGSDYISQRCGKGGLSQREMMQSWTIIASSILRLTSFVFMDMTDFCVGILQCNISPFSEQAT